MPGDGLVTDDDHRVVGQILDSACRFRSSRF